MSEQTTEQQAPSKDEVVRFLKEQIEVKSIQLELQKLNADLAETRARELKALNFISNMTVAKNDVPQGTPHTLTQEDLDANPELVEAGLKVGDEVLKSETPIEEAAPLSEKPRSLKKS